MDEKKKYAVSYYGGNLGAWMCVLTAIAGILFMLLVRGGGTKSLIVVLFMALVLGLILAKDKKAYGDEMLKGLQESMVTTIVMAFFMAGLLSSLLKSSGLIQALLWGVGMLNVPVSILPVVGFLVCVLISTACGTSTGTVTAVSAVLCPLANELGIDMGLMCGAIVSGAIFGDNLAPISDTTIASSQTQGASLRDVVRTRIPYAFIVGGISAVLYIIIGMRMSSGTNAAYSYDASSAKALIFLVLPVLLVFLMKKGWGLVSSLLLANALAVFFSLVLGVIPASTLFSDDSPIVAGMTGMANIAIVSFLLIMLLQIPSRCGAFDAFTDWILGKCRSVRDAELITYFLAVFGVVATHSSPNTIMFFGPFVRKMMDNYKEEADPCRSANILDGVSCAVNGLIPYGNPTLVITGVAAALPGISDKFNFVNFIGYNFHCWGLLIIFMASIVTGIGRNRRAAVSGVHDAQ